MLFIQLIHCIFDWQCRYVHVSGPMKFHADYESDVKLYLSWKLDVLFLKKWLWRIFLLNFSIELH